MPTTSATPTLASRKRGRHHPVVTQWREVDEDHPVGKRPRQAAGDGNRQACFADSTWPDHGEQSHLALLWIEHGACRFEFGSRPISAVGGIGTPETGASSRGWGGGCREVGATSAARSLDR